MTTEEARLAVKEALTIGPATAVKAALLQWRMCKKNEEEELNAIVAVAQDIFNPRLGQTSL